jgi:hypothetical protein
MKERVLFIGTQREEPHPPNRTCLRREEVDILFSSRTFPLWKRGKAQRECGRITSGELARPDGRPHIPHRPGADAGLLVRICKCNSHMSCTQGGTEAQIPAARPARSRLQACCRVLDAIRSGTRYSKWAGGSRSQSQTHRRAAMGGFTQDDGYVQGVAPMHCARPPRILFELLILVELLLVCSAKPQFFLILVLDTDTGTGPISPVTVSRVNAYSGGALARALPEGSRYLST